MMDDMDDIMYDEEDYCMNESDNSSEPDINLENQYYISKASMKNDLSRDELRGILKSFEVVLNLELHDKGEWGFKALKQMIKINFMLNDHKEMMTRYKQFLTYIQHDVPEEKFEKTVNSVLDYIKLSENVELLEDFYKTTINDLRNKEIDKFWLKTKIKLGKLYLEKKEFDDLNDILKKLHERCHIIYGDDNFKKGVQLLEIYALEMQICIERHNIPKLKICYMQTLPISKVNAHPFVMGTLKEYTGKIHFNEGEFNKAYRDFFEAFKYYDGTGFFRRKKCLQYLIIANILMKSEIDIFDCQEIKPYKNDPEILAVMNLIVSYESNDCDQFDEILKEHMQSITEDPFLREYVSNMIINIKVQEELFSKQIKSFLILLKNGVNAHELYLHETIRHNKKKLMKLMMQHGASFDYADKISCEVICTSVKAQFDENHSLFKLLRHLAKLEMLDSTELKNFQEGLVTWDLLYNYYLKCKEELQKMKNSIIHDNTTCFNILTDKYIKYYVTNDFITAMKSVNMYLDYPIYGDEIHTRYFSAIKKYKAHAIENYLEDTEDEEDEEDEEDDDDDEEESDQDFEEDSFVQAKLST